MREVGSGKRRGCRGFEIADSFPHCTLRGDAMRGGRQAAIWVTVIALAGTSAADFKYSETTKVTGGTLMGAMKFVGAFSKDARQAYAPQTRTVAIKGNKMREEQADGRIRIVDLDG